MCWERKLGSQGKEQAQGGESELKLGECEIHPSGTAHQEVGEKGLNCLNPLRNSPEPLRFLLTPGKQVGLLLS